MPGTADKTKKFTQEIDEHVAEGRGFNEAVAEAAKGIEVLKDVEAMGTAVKQLETKAAEDKATIKGLETRLQKAEQKAFNTMGQYRGAFASEDAARAFGLMLVAKFQPDSEWAHDALKSEHKSLYDTTAKNKVFDSASAAAVIPEAWSTMMENLLDDHGVFERNALNVPMTTVTTTFSKKTGRNIAVPMGQGETVTEGKPTLEPIELTARKWGAYTEINSEAEEDSIIALAEFVATDMVEAHALACDTAGFLGDGTAAFNSITGILNALRAGAIQVGGGADWSGFTLRFFSELIGRCTTKTFEGGTPPKWFGSHAFFWKVMAPLQLEAGGNLVQDIGNGPVMKFNGFDYEMTQVLPSVAAASQKPLVFGNMRRGAALGARRGLTIKSSDQFRFASDQTAMLSTRRWDANVFAPGTATAAETLVAVQTT